MQFTRREYHLEGGKVVKKNFLSSVSDTELKSIGSWREFFGRVLKTSPFVGLLSKLFEEGSQNYSFIICRVSNKKSLEPCANILEAMPNSILSVKGNKFKKNCFFDKQCFSQIGDVLINILLKAVFFLKNQWRFLCFRLPCYRFADFWQEIFGPTLSNLHSTSLANCFTETFFLDLFSEITPLGHRTLLLRMIATFFRLRC